MNHTNLWATTYSHILQNHQNPNEVKFWLDALKWDKAERLGPGRVRVLLSAPNNYYANYINSIFRSEIESAVTYVLGESCEVSIEVSQAQVADEVAASKLNTSPTVAVSIPTIGVSNPLAPPRLTDFTHPSIEMTTPSRSPIKTGGFKTNSSQDLFDHIDTHLTFDNYIVGPSNQFAYASAFSTAENPAVQFNPLFIYGPPAVGKTHLLHAIGNHLKKKNPHIRAYFVSAEKFVNEFIESIQHKNPGDFRAKYRENVDLLLIDDVQFIVGKDRSEPRVERVQIHLRWRNRDRVARSG